ncbi:MAG TPA: glutathione S-transferase N-terminal domain-containing protein [Polyangiaceae bacterium]|jgi:GST-like protein
MIDLYAWPTPNGFKVSICLEEMGVPYKVIPVDIGKGEQFAPEFLKISPNNRMPAIVDTESGMSVFESGAILCYLGEKTGQFFPQEKRAKYTVLEWLFWQMAGVGPMFGQLGHFTRYAPEKIPYAIERYTSEALRLVKVLDNRLAQVEYVAGEYGIADMAIFPWVRNPSMKDEIAFFKHVSRWLAAIEARPAVRRGLDLLKDRRNPAPLSDEARENLFGKKQFGR